MSTAVSVPTPLPFTMTTIDQCVIVIKITDPLTVEAFGRYQTAFKRLYDKYPHFVLVYDLTEMSMPDFAVMHKKQQLILEMKARSCRQLLAAIVITSSEIFKQTIQTLVKIGGQASPFYAFTDVGEAAATAARLAMLIKRVPNALTKPLVGKSGTGLVWGRLSHAARVAIVVFMFTRNLRHFVKRSAKA